MIKEYEDYLFNNDNIFVLAGQIKQFLRVFQPSVLKLIYPALP